MSRVPRDSPWKIALAMRWVQLPPGAASAPRIMCFKTKAVPKSTPRLRRRRNGSKGENWSFHSVHRKKNANIQWRRPCSGSTELNAWADAKKSARSVKAWEMLVTTPCRLPSHLSRRTSRPRMKSDASSAAITRVTRGGGRKTKDRSTATRMPPRRATVRNTRGRSRARAAARLRAGSSFIDPPTCPSAPSFALLQDPQRVEVAPRLLLPLLQLRLQLGGAVHLQVGV